MAVFALFGRHTILRIQRRVPDPASQRQRHCRPAPKVSPPPASGAHIPKPSEWVQQALAFTPSPKQAEILDHDAHRLILCCSRQWGKSTVLALKALHTAIHKPGARIVVLAASESQAGLLLEKVTTNAATLGFHPRRVTGRKHSLQLPNGSKIFAIAHNGRTGLGHTADILIVDEAAVVKDEVLGAVLPALARTNGKIWMLSTPNGQSGTFYELWHDDASNWLRIKATVEDSPYATREFIEEQQRLFPHKVRQDFFCEFTPPANRLFTRELIDRMIDRTIPQWQFDPLT
jgi:Terminase large subunit, T4likevirus-type, N-terminal